MLATFVIGEWSGRTFDHAWPGEPVAVKQISKIGIAQQDIEREISTLCKVKHSNIVGYFGHEKGNRNYFVVMELCQYDLAYVVAQQLLQEHPQESYLELLEAVAHLHRLQIAHRCVEHQIRTACVTLLWLLGRDLKPGNVLVSQGSLKLADFGCSKLVEQST